MKIPIPPLEIQNKLITKLDSSNDKVKYMKLIVDSMKQDIEIFFELTIEIENRKSETEWIEFGEVFTLEKGKLQSSKVEEVENDETYEGVFINLSKSNNFKKINNTILDGENIFISNTAPLGLIQYYNGKCNYSDLLQHIKVNDIYKTKINIKYMYHFLTSINEHLKEVYDKGSCNKSLDQKNFNRMKIQIPSIKQQNKCIEKINEMEEIIKRWENDIDNILNNGSNKFLEFLEGESIKFEKDKDHKELFKKKSKTIDI
jgi:restriction endonuclease S subunit